MRQFVIDFGLFNGRCDSNLPFSEWTLFQLLEILIKANQVYINCENPPSLYASGVKYIREPPGLEEWKAYGAILRDGGADCEDLASVRIAELRISGEPAKPILKRKVLGGGSLMYHILVQRMRRDDANPAAQAFEGYPGRWVFSRVEDPSRILGMGGNYGELG